MGAGPGRASVITSLLWLFATAPQAASQAAADRFPTPEISIDTVPDAAACPFDSAAAATRPGPVFEYMKGGPDRAMACAALLDERLPGWQELPEARQLLVPFVSHLLGDGTARGLQRHEVFIALLGHLEAIEPGWRYSEDLEPLMPEIILGSVVEDPFVADFWARTVQEMEEDWRTSQAAKSLVPRLYQLASAEAKEPAVTRNDRPARLLEQVSWISWAKLVFATRVVDTWPKRLLLLALAGAIAAWAVRRTRRRRRT